MTKSAGKVRQFLSTLCAANALLNGRLLLVTKSGLRDIAVLITRIVVMCIAAGGLPVPIASAVDEVSFSSAELSRLSLHGPWPVPVPVDPGNEYSGLPWAVEAGRLLFHDPGLSGSGDLSCASCHQPSQGFADGQSLAVGSGVHVRNTQSLYNAGLQRWFGWDGGTDSLWAAAMRPILSKIEMNSSVEGVAYYLRQTTRYHPYLLKNVSTVSVEIEALGDDALAVKTAKLIAAYVRTIVSDRTPFNQFRDAVVSGQFIAESVYPASARRGLKLFVGKANCHVCHYGANFSNGEFHDVGTPFFTGVGQVDPGRYRGIQRLRADPYRLSGEFNGTKVAAEIRKTERVKVVAADWGRWRTPGLRNLMETAPYMHDGSLATLRDVVDAYADIDPGRLHTEGESILKPLALTETERQDLVAFLESLSALPRLQK